MQLSSAVICFSRIPTLLPLQTSHVNAPWPWHSVTHSSWRCSLLFSSLTVTTLSIRSDTDLAGLKFAPFAIGASLIVNDRGDGVLLINNEKNC